MTVVLVGSVEAALQLALRSGALLTARERKRCDGYRNAQASSLFVAAHLLARVSLSEVSGWAPGSFKLIQRCHSCGGPHGRPIAVGPCPVSVSLAHAGRYVAVAAAPGRGPVGIDIEPLSPQVRQRMNTVSSRVLSRDEASRLITACDPEAEFLRMWVRKESLIKIGRGSLDEMPSLSAYPEEILEGPRLYDFHFGHYVGAVVSSSAPTYRHLV